MQGIKKYQKIVLNFFFFFYKILHVQKAQKEYKAPKSTKTHKNATKQKPKTEINE